MQWTVRLEARTSAGKVTTTELVTFSRPGVVSTLARAIQRCPLAVAESALQHLKVEVRRLVARGIPEPANV